MTGPTETPIRRSTTSARMGKSACTARFFYSRTLWPYGRQSPANDGVFGTTRFYFGPGPEPTDWLIVLNDLPDDTKLDFPKERTIFLSGEPPLARTFERDYLAQFAIAVAVDPDLPHPNLVALPPLIPWHVGVHAGEPRSYAAAMTFRELEPVPRKTKLCSCMTSSANSIPGHRLRLSFIERLQRELGDRIDFFGRGVQPIPDKEIALAPYRYHIALEN
jgi:hypothetical protein